MKALKKSLKKAEKNKNVTRKKIEWQKNMDGETMS